MSKSRIVGIAADLKPPLLVLKLKCPDQKIFIKSEDVWNVCATPSGKRPMYQIDGHHGIFRLSLKDVNGRVSEIAWTAKVATEADSGDLLLYDLERDPSLIITGPRMAIRPKIVTMDWPFAVFSYEADHDYLLARWISFAGGPFQSRAGFLGQQACEKYMKAVLVQASQKYLQTHRLSVLAAECNKHFAMFGCPEALADLSKFDVFEQVGRYGAAANYDPLSAKPHAAGVWYWDDSYLPSLDRTVFNIRRLLDYSAIKFNDSLLSILRQDENSLETDWKGQPSLFDVLTRENAYFTPHQPPSA